MILINLHRVTECSLCDRQVPIRFPSPNAKQYGDERDTAQLCTECERTAQAYAKYEREREEWEAW